jgi:23S rRNA pseudouridine2605 synthase
MTDKTKGGGGSKGRPPSRGPRSGDAGGGRPPRSGGDRPFRARTEDGDRPRPARAGGGAGDRPFRKRTEGEAGERPYRARSEGAARPQRPRPEGGDRPYRGRTENDAGERPARKRPGGERPARARTSEGGERKERSWSPEGDRPRPRRSEGTGERTFRPREDGDRPRPRRTEGAGERTFRPREDGDRPRPRRSEGTGERTFRPREDGDRPRPRRDDGDRPFRPRRDDGERSGRGREDRGRSAPRVASGGARKEFAERVAKVIARAGLCSRRDAEAWIEAGRVAVNGTVLTSPALDVSKSDVVTVDGTPLPTRERTRLFLYHKPRGIVTTARDPEGRATVFESLPPGLPRVVTVGRLDINTEGLLLLTNDGGLSRVLELPETGWLRRYRVRAFGAVDQAVLDTLKDGVTIEGMHYGPVEAEIDREKGDNVWLIIGLREGKNREVKKILEHLGLQVNRLIRVSFGPFQLGDLPEGAAEEVTTRILVDQLGPELAARAEADFESPVFVYDEDDFRPKKREPRERERDIEHRRERFGRDDRGDRGERPARGRFGEDRESRGRRGEDEAEERPRPARRHPTEIVRSTWRAEDVEPLPAAKRVPRRGADPKAARVESAGREHIRAGRVKSRAGREVLVEKVARDPAAAPPREDRQERWPERGERAPRSRNTWSDGGDRGERPARAPRRREEGSEGRPARSFGDKPRTPRREGEGPRPAGRTFRPREDRDAAGERPRGPRREGGPGGGKRPFGKSAPRPEGRSEGAGDRPFRPKSGPRPGGSRPGGGGGRPGGPSRGPGGPRRPRRDD